MRAAMTWIAYAAPHFTRQWLGNATALACIALSLGAAQVWGQISAGPAPGGPSQFLVVPETLEYPEFGNPFPSGEFDVGSPAGPVSVTYDPGSGPFVKELVFTSDRDGDGDIDGTDLNLDRLASPFGTLHEYFEVGPGSLPFTDWHEEILTPNWFWVGTPQLMAFDSLGNPLPVNWQVNVQGNTLDFYFDPLPPGTLLSIWKDFDLPDYGPGTEQIYADLGFGTFSVQVGQYPSVPEPSAVVLMALGAAGLWAFAQRRRG